MRFLFALSYRQRCGLNHVRSLLHQLLGLHVLELNGWEPPLGEVLAAIEHTLATRVREPADRERLAGLFARGLRRELEDYVAPRIAAGVDTVLIQRCSLEGAEQLVREFPDSRFVLLTRDPRDVVTSFVKATDLDAGSSARRLARRTAHAVGAYHQRVASGFREEIRGAAPTLARLAGHERCLRLRYEDLLETDGPALARFVEFVGAPADAATLERCRRAPVVGSSYSVEELAAPRWQRTERTADFNPRGRWRRLPPAQRLGTLLGLRGSHRLLGYTQNETRGADRA